MIEIVGRRTNCLIEMMICLLVTDIRVAYDLIGVLYTRYICVNL